jgi:hypothetical protein
MPDDQTSNIIEAERTTRGLLITFEDGEYAVYPSELLYSLLYVARTMIPELPEDGCD